MISSISNKTNDAQQKNSIPPPKLQNYADQLRPSLPACVQQIIANLPPRQSCSVPSPSFASRTVNMDVQHQLSINLTDENEGSFPSAQKDKKQLSTEDLDQDEIAESVIENLYTPETPRSEDKKFFFPINTTPV